MFVPKGNELGNGRVSIMFIWFMIIWNELFKFWHERFKYTRSDQKVPRLIFLLGCGCTSGHPCLQGGFLELPLSLGQGMVPARLSALCELRSKRVVYLHLVIVRAVRDVGRARASPVHQILCETGKKWCADIWNVENCLRWAVFDACSLYRMAEEI